LHRVFGQSDGLDVFGEPDQKPGLDEILRGVLVASVDPSLPAADRARLAAALAEHYVQARESWLAAGSPYSANVNAGFAAATQPLLEGWQDENGGQIVILGGSGDETVLPDAALWDAVRLFAEDPGGIDGLSSAVAGTTTARLVDSYQVGTQLAAEDGFREATYPFETISLVRLGEVYRTVATTVGNERFSSLVEAVEQDNRLEDATWAAVSGIVGEAPGGDAVAGVVDALLVAEQDPEVTGGGNPLAGVEPHVTKQLVALTLVARPDLATLEVRSLLLNAVDEAGANGVHDLMRDPRAALDGGGAAFAELQELVLEQTGEINLGVALAIGEVTDLSGG
jgi:hypothetical protein